MTLAQTKRNNVVIGGGELFLDIFDAAGARTGELYLGDAVGATLGIVTEETTIFSGTGKVAVELARITRSISRTFNIGVRDMSLQNLALFAIGDLADDAIAADAVADETIAPVLPGRWYQLGTTAKRPAGINKVGKVTVAGGTVDAAGDFTAAAGANAWAKDADYVVDEGSGRVMILDTAKTKAAGAAIQVDYTPAAQADRQQVQAKTKQVEGAFRYIEDAARGQGRNFYAPDCLIRPNGELPLLDGRNSEQQIALTVAALEPGGGLPALLIDGQPQE